MPEKLTRGELTLVRVALRLHTYEYNHEDEHLRELNSVYNKLVGMELAYDQDESGNVKCQSCGDYYPPDEPDDWGMHLIELCNPCFASRWKHV